MAKTPSHGSIPTSGLLLPSPVCASLLPCSGGRRAPGMRARAASGGGAAPDDGPATGGGATPGGSGLRRHGPGRRRPAGACGRRPLPSSPGWPRPRATAAGSVVVVVTAAGGVVVVAGMVAAAATTVFLLF